VTRSEDADLSLAEVSITAGLISRLIVREREREREREIRVRGEKVALLELSVPYIINMLMTISGLLNPLHAGSVSISSAVFQFFLRIIDRDQSAFTCRTRSDMRATDPASVKAGTN